MYSLKFWLTWVLGVVVAGLVLSLLQNGEVDWGHIVTMSIGGLIGVLIASGIKKNLKKEED
ncbi:hypothetical protein SAMN05192559_11219 [Halobacillus karajensis]|uniref:Uncharacterized protein n=1 Tax=Halobacillus karajensis TaxID=195088 RepID=A0A024P9E0_9BACI|nr:hypothetical protein [Halobacillus karajensis]CDQ21250.1 hypothetical protein BN982_03616 [Halobacillus karajensis]CDQ25326.1 hypothetical protein BN983_03644 [Halobacillus karajensis]CDQ25951.1 hypothetical protein BN981_00158 [Halobacillus karajensis]SEI10055.1 hypothetical protein SAMN05192559_11219 [Halobacillus karajensis]